MNLATRHLCAGTYLDDDYRDRVLRDVYGDQGRAVAPYMGADTATVLSHAKHARVLRLAEMGALGGCVLVALAVSVEAVFYLAVLLAVWQFAVLCGKLLRDVLRYLRDPTQEGRAAVQGRFTLVQLIGVPLLIGFVVTTLLSSISSITSSLFGSGPDYDSTPEEPEGAGAGGFALLLIVLILVTVAFGCVRWHRLVRLKDGTTPPLSGDPRLLRARNEENRRLVVYSGFDPFAGAGMTCDAWQFAVKLRPAEDAAMPAREWRDFDIGELVAHIGVSLGELADDDGRFFRIPGLTVDDQLFLSGLGAQSPLRTDPDPAVIAEIMRRPTGITRHYLKCQTVDWDGEIVTTVYIHAALQGRALYLEFWSLVMPPTREDWHVFDEPLRVGALGLLSEGFRSAFRLPRTLAKSPVVLARAVFDALRTAALNDARPLLGMADFGARTSVRLLGADHQAHNFFQFSDPVKYTEILERHMLAAVTGFLREHGADVSELEERATTVINNGIMNSGSGARFNTGVMGAGHGNVTIGAVGNRSRGKVTPGK